MSKHKNDDQATELYQDEQSWLPPVATKADLPQDVRPGAFAFVEDEGAVYQLTANKGWYTTKKPKGR